jgi:hypothetical protein
MNQLFISGNYILVFKNGNPIPFEYPCGKSVYSENEDEITLFEDGKGTLIIPKSEIDGGRWENDLAQVLTQSDIVTLFRTSTGFNLPSNGGGGLTSIDYSTVIWVDSVFGNDGTAAVGRFDKPHLTIQSALTMANAQLPTSTNRACVIVRSGSIANAGNITPVNFCDVYCEEVLFTGYFYMTDQFAGTAVDFNWYGNAKWNLSMSQVAFRWQYASNVLIKGDSFVNLGAISIAFNVTIGTSDITYDFNSMESLFTSGGGFAFSWRNNCNGTVNVKKHIKSPHIAHDVRANHSGNITINCPRNIMTATNIYGGNFKQIVYSTSSQATSKIVINGDLFDEGVYFGGISAMILIQAGSCEVVHNGNNQCNTVAMWNGGAGRIISNGTIISTQTIGINNGSGETYCKNGTLSVTGLASIREFYVSGTARSWFVNTPMFMEKVDSVMIQQDSNTSKIFMINVTAEGGGLLGTLINAAVVGTVNQFTNVVSNKVNVNVVNELAQGFIVDALIKTPNF